jgi:myosin-1
VYRVPIAFTQLDLQVDSINDARDFKAVQSAFRTIQTFDQQAVDGVWRVVAAIIHLGNLEFNPMNHNEESEVADKEALRLTAGLLDVDPTALGAALCSRVVAARGDVVSKQHNVNDALFGRDALAKVFALFAIFIFLPM